MLVIYLVGGAIRDKLLNLNIKELDWLVIGSDFDLMFKMGFHLVGKDFPVFLHPITKEEYALARKEKKISVGYTGFKCDFTPLVSLDEDLVRRDLTVNAIVLNKYGFLIDKLHGIEHLNKRLFVHTSLAFREDPLRVLRLSRFITKYSKFKFFVSFNTYFLVKKIVLSGEMQYLVLERVLKEFFLIFKFRNCLNFFDFLFFVGALKYLFVGLYLIYKWSCFFKYNSYLNLILHLNNIFIVIYDYTNNLNLKFAMLFFNLEYDFFLCYKIFYKKKNEEKFSFYKNFFNLSKKNYKFIIFLSILKLFFYRFFLLHNSAIFSIFNKINAYKDKVRFINLLFLCDLDSRLNFKINIFYEKYRILDILNNMGNFNVLFYNKYYSDKDFKTLLYKKKINDIKRYKRFYENIYF